MPFKMTRWQLCLKCGRKFLAIVTKNRQDEWGVCCPECRAEMSRKVSKEITDKWLGRQ